MNIDKVLDECKTIGLDEYDLKPIVIKAIHKEYYKRYDIYLNESEIDTYHIDTLETSIKAITDKYIADFETMDNAKIYYNFHLLGFRVDELNDKVIMHRYFNGSNSELIALIRYAITGNFDKDYTEVNKILDLNNPRINYDNHQWDIKINDVKIINTKDIQVIDVKIKSFKNGKIIITGLNQTSRDRIKYGFNIVAKKDHKNIIA